MRYAAPLLVINILGSAYGYYWYKEQLAQTAKTLWLFVPDSPLATTMLALMLVVAMLGYRIAFLCVLACTACIKYGLWAVIMISDYWLSGGELRFDEAMLWVSHLGMAVQGVVFLITVNRSWFLVRRPWRVGNNITAPVVAVTAGWMFLNDFLDYYLGIHPYLYLHTQGQLAAVSVVSLSILLVLSIILFPLVRLADNNRL